MTRPKPPFDLFDPVAFDALGAFLNEFFNGIDCPPGEERVGFFLATRQFNAESVEYKCITSFDDDSVRIMLADLSEMALQDALAQITITAKDCP